MKQVMEFRSSNPLSIGMEMEFQLLDAQTLDLVDGIMPLLEFYRNNPYVKPEFIQNTVEVCSKICDNLVDLKSHVLSLVVDLQSKCKELGMKLCSAGTHPFSRQLGIITPLPRYLRQEKRTGYLGHTQITFATHVHIGMESGNEAVRVMRQLKTYLPLLIALSANSPFWRGYDTDCVAYRHRILAATRSYGIPPSFETWNDFCRFLNATCGAGIFETINDIHWDIRPRPHLGTLEIRVMDAQPTVSEAITLVGFIRALATYLKNTGASTRPPELPGDTHWWIEKDNHYQASRLGLKAKYVKDEAGSLTDMTMLYRDVLAAIEDTAAQLGQSSWLEQLRTTVNNGASYVRQRDVYEKTGSLKKVVVSLIDTLEKEIAANVSSADV